MMKALALTPGSTTLRLVDRPEPSVAEDDQVKLQVIRVGICGTDREEAAGGRARAPKGQSELIIGHEMLGRVVEVGRKVTRVVPGDLALFTVRRGCGHCSFCDMNRPDMCLTGEYQERGIWGMDGYQAQYVVDRERYLVVVPSELESVAVLTEPLSVAEKAIDEAERVQAARLPSVGFNSNWLVSRRCLVAGLGPIGLLAALVLRLRGAELYGLDIVREDSVRPRWLGEIGGHYLDGRRLTPEQILDTAGPMDLIFESTGVAQLAFNLLDALAINGAYVLTGIPGGERPLQLQGAELMRRLVLNNQVMLGSVNASADHYQVAVTDLGQARLRWGPLIDKLITGAHHYSDFMVALDRQGDDEIKVVVEWVGHQPIQLSQQEAVTK